MEVSKKVILQTLIPRIPGILLTYFSNILSLSPGSRKQTAKLEVIVYIVRAFGRLRRTVGLLQQRSTRDPGIRGRLWVSKVVAPCDLVEPRDAVIRGIHLLGADHGWDDIIVVPETDDVYGEWTGFRSQASRNSPRLDVPEAEQYVKLMAEVSSDLTILYFHGGAYFMMDPATHRGIVYSLAKRSGGRCFSVRYRLAPQYPFPAALLDALVAYLYLLAPPKGSSHEPVKPKHIVLSGDSAGAGLACALGLLLNALRKNGTTTIRYNGVDVPVELPAGIALNSPWCDVGRTLPSYWTNAKYDYLEPPNSDGLVVPDEYWPASPPRAELYCQASLLLHPLVSPVTATPEMWEGCPPVFICTGNEALEDEITVMARNIYLSGTPLEFHAYEGMPHCFVMVISGSAVANDCVDKWAKFCIDASQGRVEQKEDGSWWKAKTSPFEFYHVKLADMGLADGIVQEKMQRANDQAIERERKEMEAWQGLTRVKKSA